MRLRGPKRRAGSVESGLTWRFNDGSLSAPPSVSVENSGSRTVVPPVPGGRTGCCNDWDLVFTTDQGDPVSGSVVTHQFQALLKASGLPRQRFHDLRHAAASFMLAQDVPLRVAMDVLGHSEIAVTANTYSHVAPAIQREAMERVSELLWGNP